jgi:hypothetical protein
MGKGVWTGTTDACVLDCLIVESVEYRQTTSIARTCEWVRIDLTTQKTARIQRCCEDNYVA